MLMAEVHILMVPTLRSSTAKAANLIVQSDYDTIFLNFPYNLQSIVLSYAAHQITLNHLLNMIRIQNLIPEPVTTWIYLNQPLLECLPKLKEETKIFCYKDVDGFHMSMEAASKIASLTLKVNVTEKIDVEEWIQTLKQLINQNLTDLEAEFIASRAEGKSICITGLNGWKLAKRIKEFSHKVTLKCVERQYVMKPLETLEILLEKGKPEPQTIQQLIKEHATFIKNYVLNTKNIDEAYYTWIKKYKLLNINAKS